MKQKNVPPRGGQGGRRTQGRAQDDHIDDTYKVQAKRPEPSYCPQCGAVYQNGRWQWLAKPDGAKGELCQACHRSNDHYPAGIVTLSGDFALQHKGEITALVHHNEATEKREHPLNRIIDIEDHPDRMVINTTDIHLPRRIGEALAHAYKGKLDFHYDEDAYFVRVNWQRDT